MKLTLKNFQVNALRSIESFLTQARGATSDTQVAQAFERARRDALGDSAPRSIYRPFSSDLPTTPQACIRIPTGGGKTLLIAHAIERAARLFVGTSNPVALWLVPSTTIRNQTLDALRKPGHPYRDALEQYSSPDRLRIVDITECDQLRPDDFGSSTIVILATFQAARVADTGTRDVYAYREVFEPHFARLPPDLPYFERVSESDIAEQPYLRSSDIGKVKYSLANLLAHHRPIVMVDEAHNATTKLSSETLKRLRPACVLEWTATPAPDQNVLYTVSALELKAEHLLKLPIVLSPHPNWQEAVRDAVLTRERLAKEALADSDYVRPIVLFQAQPKDGEVVVDTLREHLVSTLCIDAKRIAVATGTQRELDGIDLFDKACTIDFVITVEALREGWDCSFAYVFCTVQRIRSAKDLEQLLGRVLRLPYAAPRSSEHLNRAYAHVSEPATLETANQLADHLINMGFEAFEAVNSIVANDAGSFDEQEPAQKPQPVESVLQLPASAADALLASGGPAVKLTKTSDGYEATITGVLPSAAVDAVVQAMPDAQRNAVRRTLKQHQARALKAISPRDRGVHLSPIPRFAVPVQGEMVLLEPSLLGDLAGFSLAGKDAELPGFSKEAELPKYLIDVEDKRVRFLGQASEDQLRLDAAMEGIRREDVIRTLDSKLRRHDIPQPDMIAWLGGAIDSLANKGIELAYMARHMNHLADALAAKIESLVALSQRAAFQQVMSLGDDASKARLDAAFDFRFPESNYPARWYYDGRYCFQKHYYGPPGELDSDTTAEETTCAIQIDQLPEVRCWVRNLERQPDSSFWLPTSTDRFYPDFVLELTSGRIVVVEYKGADRYSNDDSREKRDIGSVWAAASNDRCRFVMATDPSLKAGVSVADQIKSAF